MRKILAFCLSLLCLMPGAGAGAEKRITVSFTGDVTLGGTETGRNSPESFDSHAAQQGYEYFFRNVRALFQSDDLTLVNLEGVLSDSRLHENKKKAFRFRGKTDFVNILTLSGIEACNVANNHTTDFGRRGYRSTVTTLKNAGVSVCGNENSFIYTSEGIQIAFFSFNGSYMTDPHIEETKEIIWGLRDDGVNAVVCCFHAGQEYAPGRRGWDQERYAAVALEEWGADLVVMHHPHVLQGIDRTDSAYIFYSLGNFCFGGNAEIRCKEGYPEIRTLETAVLQMDLVFDDRGVYLGQEGRIYPCFSSSSASAAGDMNDYQPKLVSGEEAEGVLERTRRIRTSISGR